MGSILRIRHTVLTAVFLCLSGCGHDSLSEEEAKYLRSDYVRLDDVRPRLADDFTSLESRARAGVDPSALAQALSGNRVIPRAIADSFARNQRMSEARYWLQIGAENGDGISMQQLSITLDRESCWRARYWLERAVKSGHLPSLAQSDAEEGLAKYAKTCPGISAQ